MELLGGPDAPISLKDLEFLPEGMRQQLLPGVRYLDFKAVVARPMPPASDRAQARGGVGIGFLNTLPIFEHPAGIAVLGVPDSTAVHVGRVAVMDIVATDDVGERAPLRRFLDRRAVRHCCIKRHDEGTPATLALDGEKRAFVGVDVGDAMRRELAIARYALLIEPARRFGDA